jgi:hypothetical protein
VINQNESIVAFSAKFTRAQENLANAGVILSDVDAVDQYLHCLRTAPDSSALPLDQFRQQRVAEYELDRSLTSLTLLVIQFRLQQEETRRRSQSKTRHFQGGRNPSRDSRRTQVSPAVVAKITSAIPLFPIALRGHLQVFAMVVTVRIIFSTTALIKLRNNVKQLPPSVFPDDTNAGLECSAS